VRNWSPEPEERRSSERWREVRGGRRWEDFGVDGEREGKFGGKLGETKMRKMGGMNWFWWNFEILNFFFFFFEKKKTKRK